MGFGGFRRFPNLWQVDRGSDPHTSVMDHRVRELSQQVFSHLVQADEIIMPAQSFLLPLPTYLSNTVML